MPETKNPMKSIPELWDELKQICEDTDTRFSGMEYLVHYYMDSLGWPEEDSILYAIDLFHNGTITQIKLIGKDGSEI